MGGRGSGIGVSVGWAYPLAHPFPHTPCRGVGTYPSPWGATHVSPPKSALLGEFDVAHRWPSISKKKFYKKIFGPAKSGPWSRQAVSPPGKRPHPLFFCRVPLPKKFYKKKFGVEKSGLDSFVYKNCGPRTGAHRNNMNGYRNYAYFSAHLLVTLYRSSSYRPVFARQPLDSQSLSCFASLSTASSRHSSMVSPWAWGLATIPQAPS